MFHTFKNACLAAAVAVLPLAVQAAGLGPLIDPISLEAALADQDPVVLDIRGGAFEEGHIPGALSAPYGEFRGPSDNPGSLVPQDKMTEVLRGLGITTDRPVVVVHQGRDQTDFGAAARVYWTLKSSGVSDLAILNGGMNGWLKAGLRVQKGAPEAVTPSDITVNYSQEWLATRDEILEATDRAGQATYLEQLFRSCESPLNVGRLGPHLLELFVGVLYSRNTLGKFASELGIFFCQQT